MRISDWSSDVCSSDLGYYDLPQVDRGEYGVAMRVAAGDSAEKAALYEDHGLVLRSSTEAQQYYLGFNWLDPVVGLGDTPEQQEKTRKLRRSEEHTSELQSLMRISYAVLCLKKKNTKLDQIKT